MSESIPCKYCGLYYMHRATCVENMNTLAGRELPYYEIRQSYQPIIYELNMQIQKLKADREVMVEALRFYASWAKEPYQCADYPHNEFGFVQFDVHQTLVKALKSIGEIE